MKWVASHINESVRIKEMYTFFRTLYDNTFTFSGETHDFWECVYVLSGEISVSADERVYDLKKGQIIFHKPLELHKFHVTDKSGAELIIFSFSAEGELLSFLKDKVFSLNLIQENIMRELISYADTYADKSAGQRMFLSAFESSKTYSQTVSLFLQRLFLSLSENNVVLESSNEHESKVFSTAVSFMNESLNEKPTIEEIASRANVSVSSLKRIFTKFAGMGIHKYFLKLKLKRAAELLVEGRSVTEVSEKLGFSSQGYFTKTFKRETGVLPSETLRRK